MCFFGAVAHQSSMQELDLLNPQLDPRISYSGGPKMFFGPAGLLQESAGNYLLWSEDFSNVAWSKDQATVTVNAALGPFGGMTADLIVPSTTNTTSHRVYQDYAAPASIAYCDSLYVKAAGYNFVRLTNFSGAVTVDLTSGAVVFSSGAPDAFKVSPAPQGFWRIEVGKTVAVGTVRTQIAVYDSAAQTSYAGDGVKGVYVFGAMKNKGTAAVAYLTTTSAPAYEWPLEYDPMTLQPLGRSVWEQRTNLLLYSKDFTNAYWSPNVVTVTPNAAIALDGTMTACRVSGSNAFSQMVGTAFNVTGGQRHTISLYITPEQALGNWALRAYRAADQYAAVELDFSGATPTGVITEAGVAAASEFSIRRAGNGRWRVSLSFTPTASVAWTFRFYLNYGVAAVKSAIIEGAQAEVGAFATPLIPTSGSQVTRVRDVPDLIDLRSVRFNQAGGQTINIEYLYENGNNYALLQVADATTTLDSDWLVYSNNNPDGFIARMYSASSAGNHFGGAFTAVRGAVNKGVVAADQSGTMGTLNAAPIKSAANAIPPSSGLLSARLGQTSAGSAPLNGYLRRIQLRPAKLAQSEALALAA